MTKQPLRSPRGTAAVVAALLAATTITAPAQNTAAPSPGTAPARLRGEPLTLNFVNAEIEGVARAMSAILNRPILVDPRVKGTITLYSERAVRPDQAYRSFLAALRGLGFTVVEVEGLLKVVPEADAKLQTGTVSIGDSVSRRGDQVLTQIFKLSHENANNLVPVLRPLISPNNTINATPGANTLVITDYADNLRRIAKIIAAMDTPSSGDVEVIALQHAVASDIAPLVQRMSDTQAVPGAPGGAGGALQVLVDARSNSLLVKAPTAARMANVRSLIEQLDRPLAGAGALGNIWVVHLKNADAVKLATVLRAAFGAGGGPGGGSSAPVSSPFGTSSPTPTMPSATTGGATSAAAATPVGASPSPSTGGFVQADPASNSLIITAPEPLYRQVRAMIDQLDSRRAQIYIESMIVEVSGDNSADFGFQWQGLIGNSGDSFGVVAGTNSTVGGPSIISLAQTAAGVGTTLPGEGLNIGLIRNFAGAYNLAAIARILQSQANTNIVSTPNIVTLDNEEAKIIVGSNVPFITGQFTNTGTATTSPFQTIERKDVGITLRIRPQVGEGGTVRMTLFQESSSLSSTTAPGTSNAGPSTDKRSIESTVMVDDGQILVLGGLIEDRYTDNKSKVPLLGDIPYLGSLFRSESRTKRRTNLMVFLRPIVMRDGETTGRMSIDRYEQIRAFQEDRQPQPSSLLPISASPVLPPLVPPKVAPVMTLPLRPIPGAPAPLSSVPDRLPAPAAR